MPLFGIGVGLVNELVLEVLVNELVKVLWMEPLEELLDGLEGLMAELETLLELLMELLGDVVGPLKELDVVLEALKVPEVPEELLVELGSRLEPLLLGF